jgi:ABC-type phosphate transport system permease subunit
MIFVSASREKIRRREERAEGLKNDRYALRKATRKEKKLSCLKTISGIAALVLIILIILFYSSLLYSSLTAIRMGNWKFKNTDFNYGITAATYNTIPRYIQPTAITAQCCLTQKSLWMNSSITRA